MYAGCKSLKQRIRAVPAKLPSFDFGFVLEGPHEEVSARVRASIGDQRQRFRGHRCKITGWPVSFLRAGTQHGQKAYHPKEPSQKSPSSTSPIRHQTEAPSACFEMGRPRTLVWGPLSSLHYRNGRISVNLTLPRFWVIQTFIGMSLWQDQV